MLGTPAPLTETLPFGLSLRSAFSPGHPARRWSKIIARFANLTWGSLSMKLIEALETLRTEPPSGARPFRVSLVCSFTPAHLQTFLQAHLARALPENRVQMTSGLYGDFWGNLARLQQENPDAGVLVMEWSDLDPRLGLRSLGNWSPNALEDILKSARSRAEQFQENIQRIARTIPLAISFPTLPLPPVSFTPQWRA